MRRTWAVVLVLLGLSASAVAKEIGYIEDFALAKDRAEALKQLIPGTEDYYYYHCLHYQNTGDWDKYAPLFKLWVERYKSTARIKEMQNRYWLLMYEGQPRQSLDYIARQLRLTFSHQREILGRRPQLPTQLNQGLISRTTLTRREMGRNNNTLNGFADSALEWLIRQNLSPERRRHLLQRLKRPDYAGLPKMVVDDLNHRYTRGFGSLKIHGMLMLSQLDEVLRLKGDLINNTNFVNTYLRKLRPNDDVDWRHDPKLREAYLDRLWTFVGKLAPAFNSLKANVLYRRLVHDRALGVYDKDRFMTYIKLPRNVPYIEPKYIRIQENRRYAANLNADHRSLIQMAPVRADDQLVRSYLMHFFLKEDSTRPYEPYIRDTWVKPVFAETKIVNGLGDMEKWYSMLSPSAYQALKERVDLDFAYTNRTYFDPDDAVKLGVHVKNVDKLIVKVYEVNAMNYYLKQDKEVGIDINLDGLVANTEDVHPYKDPPLRRVLREFTFDKLKTRGVYVVEFIGGGQRSRALIRKGKLRFLVRSSTAGHIFNILDEKNNLLKDATLWMGGTEYKSDEDGEIAVPFTNRPTREKIILQHKDFATLEHVQHRSEQYRFDAGFWVDREALLKRREATLLVRPTLALNDTPVTLSVLEEVRLYITSVDREGVGTTKEVPGFKLLEGRESTYTFRVPENVSRIGFALRAKVQNLSQNKKQDLADSQNFDLNAIDRTERVEDLHLLCADGKYTLEVLGKTGEPRADRPVYLNVKHRDFNDDVNVTLQTDASGRIRMGELKDITWLRARGPEGTKRTWYFLEDGHSYPNAVHGRVGETLYVPYMGAKKEAERVELSLLELRGKTFVADRFDAMTVKDGFIEIKGLPRGDYDLLIKDFGTRIAIRVAEGQTKLGYVLSENRQLEVTNPKPLQITRIDTAADTVTIRLANANKWTRVHVAADRYLPEYPIQSYLGTVGFPQPTVMHLAKLDSLYIAGRKIGDEYRYILERKYAKKFPGNMLGRPSLLLNPWVLHETKTALKGVTPGEGLFGKAEGRGGRVAGKGWGGLKKQLSMKADFTPNLDFLAEAAVVLANLEPDRNGLVTIKRADLGGHQMIHVLAADPMNTVYRRITLAEPKVKFLDLRLVEGLDPAKHFTEQKQISVVARGAKLIIGDITTSKVEPYDTLGKVYRLYATLSSDATLNEFAFILNWPKMKEEEKRKMYSKYACHELHFFLHKKDAKFFKDVVKPYIANKKDKTFLDHWLLGGDLSDYLQPWNFERLNVVERVLLARVVRNEPQRVARHVKDLYDLLPPNVEEFNRLFKTALKGSALEVAAAVPGVRPADALVAFDRNEEALRRYGDRARAATNGKRAARTAAAKPSAPRRDAPRKRELAEKAKALKLADKGEAKEGEAYFKADRAKDGRKLRQLYRKLEKTKEWVENNYYHLPIERMNATRVTVNAFWKDYAAHDGRSPFLSVHLAEAHRNFTEMMFALSVLDLPFEAGEHKADLKDRAWTIDAASPVVIYHKEIKETKPAEERVPILISQNFFRHSDRYRHVNNERIDKYVTDEFIIHTVYGCHLVITNPTSSRQKLDLLLQVPRGAMPVLNGQYTRSIHLDLQPYHTKTLEYHFYFPAPGKFQHYPVHVAKDERMIAAAEPFTFNVVAAPTKVDTESWDWISQNGTADQVIAYLNANNLGRVKLDRIAWRMRDVKFFRKVVDLLRKRHVYDNTLWSYGIKHNELAAAREFLKHADAFVRRCGEYIDTKLLTIDPVIRKTYQHMEYDPLVNARRHPLGKRRSILNNRFHAQYHRLMKVLGYRPKLDDDDLMAVTYYMLLQDRVADAMDFFGRVNARRLQTRLQHDYFQAYIDFYEADLRSARNIAKKYEKYPVDRWRKRFANVTVQLDEIEGKAAAVVDDEDRTQLQTKLAATQPGFDFTVEAKRITLNYQNLSAVTVNYYLMDVELLFSQNPFLQEHSGQFAYIRPNASQAMKLDAKKTQTVFDLPRQFHSSNVMVEIVGAGVRKSQAYYANELAIQVIENYGHVKVTQKKTGRMLPKVYVKVYAKMKNGGVKFYKDGYTDLRGRFDYTSLSTDELDAVEKFSILILSEADGAVVREAAPPKR